MSTDVQRYGVSVPAPTQVKASIAEQITTRTPTLRSLLPPDVPWPKFQAGVWAQFVRYPKLNDCTDRSIQAAILDAAQHGMVPGDHCHLLPFKQTCTYVQNYQGVCLELDRTGRVSESRAEPVYTADHFVCDELAGVYEFRKHWGRDRGEIMCFVAWVRLKGEALPIVRPMHLDDVEKVRKNAPGGEQDAWLKWPEAMGAKTALKKLKKYVVPTPTDTDTEMQPIDYTQVVAPTDAEAKTLIDELTGGDYTHDNGINDEPIETAQVPAPAPPVVARTATEEREADAARNERYGPPPAQGDTPLWESNEALESAGRVLRAARELAGWTSAEAWAWLKKSNENAKVMSDIHPDIVKQLCAKLEHEAGKSEEATP